MTTASGFRLAFANPKGDPSVLFAVPVLGLLVALYPFNNQWFIYVGSILSMGIILKFAPVPGKSFQGIIGWSMGKILTAK